MKSRRPFRINASSRQRKTSASTQPGRRKGAKLAIEPLEARALLAAVVSDALNFNTTDQSMWGPGTDPVASTGFEKVFTVVPESIPAQNYGSISNVNNPLADAWDVAVDACKLVLPDVLGFDDDCTTFVRDGVTVGPILGLGPFTIPGLGSRPPETVKDGLQLKVDGALDIGISGSLDVTPGSVNVDYPTTAILEILDSPILPGELFTIRTTETPGAPTMNTEFSEIDASIRGIIDVSASIELDQYILGLHTIDLSDGFDTGKQSREILGTTIGTDSIELRGPFGAAPEISLSPIGKNFSIPALPPPYSAFAGFPFADVQLLFPDLDTPPNSTFDGETITNSQLPVTRTGDGITPIDFAKVDLDVDSLSLLSGTPLGIELGIPLAATFEVNIIDTDLGAFFGIGQTMTFDAELMVDLHFSTPTQVETSPGVFETVSVYRTAVGQDVNAIHPGGELTIDPVYSVADNLFTNDTDILLSPVYTASFLQLKVSGVLNSLLGIAGDFYVFQDTLAIGDPQPIASIADTQFSLQGFNSVAGTSLAVPSLVPPEIDLASLTLAPISAFEGSPVTYSGLFEDLNAEESHDVAIDWGDGTPVTNIPVAAADAKEFAASHTYADDGTFIIQVTVTDENGESDDVQTSFAVANVAPILTLTGDGAVDEAAEYTLDLSASDVGADAVSEWTIDWGDGAMSTANGTAASVTHTYVDGDAVHSVQVSATDEDGTYSADPFFVTVLNVAPVLVVSGAAAVNEGSEYLLGLEATDMGDDTIAQWMIDWGDGNMVTVDGSTESVGHIYADGEDNHSIQVSATDEDGTYAADPLAVAVHNVAPVLDVSGAAAVDEGSDYTLNLGAMDVGDDSVNEWSIDWGDGDMTTVPGGTTSVVHTYADGNASPTIQVSATDEDGTYSADSIAVSVNNVVPSVSLSGSSLNYDPTGATVPFSGVRGQTLHFAGAVTDAGFDNPADTPATQETITYVIDFGDGTSTSQLSATIDVVGSAGVPTAASFAADHVYAEAGVYTLRVTVTDDDGGVTELTEQVTIESVAMQTGGNLAVGGTTQGDNIFVIGHFFDDEVQVRVDNQWMGPYTPTGTLIAFGQGGNDRILVTGRVDVPAWIDGGDGNDFLLGSDEDDVLLGGAGDDTLTGLGGRNVLIGGGGADRLIAGNDGDLLIAGLVGFADRDAAIGSIVAEWTSGNDYDTRVANLSGVDEAGGNAQFASRSNGEVFLREGETVLDDGARDWLFGLGGRDWYFFESPLDIAIGVRSDEAVGNPV